MMSFVLLQRNGYARDNNTISMYINHRNDISNGSLNKKLFKKQR